MLSNKILITLLLLIGLATAYVVFKDQKKDEMVKADRGFTVENFSDVSKIVLKHVKMQPLVFTRKGQGWLLNQYAEVDPAVFSNIQAALTGMRMLYTPPLAATKTVMKSIKENGIQVDVYVNNNQTPDKIFFVGTDTQKGDGTFMIMNGSSQPYVMYLPGLHGGLRSRFEQPEKNYRDKFIYKFSAEAIDVIRVEYPKYEIASFEISVSKSPVVNPVISDQPAPGGPELPGKILAYIDQFASTGTEGVFNDFPMKDSLLSLVPDCRISLRLKNGEQIIDEFFSYEHFMERNGIYRTPEEIRSGNRNFILRNKKDLYLAQNKVIGSFFNGYTDFFAKPHNLKTVRK